MRSKLMLLALVTAGVGYWWTGQGGWPEVALAEAPPLREVPVSIARPPVQRAVGGGAPALKLGDYRLLPQATFHVEARVLSTNRHRFGRTSTLVPVDFALGWGRMAEDAVLDHVEVWQSGNFYYWRAERLPISAGEIARSSANMHMIPANASVKAQLEAVRPGQQVLIRGWLVHARADDGWRWNSSLTRNDTGSGACELVLVAELTAV